jgi:uncharacterized protein YjbI with pentapeptide repeats
MGEKRSWWKQIKTHPVRTVLMALLTVVIVIIILSILGYIFNWHWTGLVPESSEPKQHSKTLWDWLQLVIIPAVLAVAGYVINLTISRGEQAATEQRAKSEREAAEKRDETERQIALDNQREAALQGYIDKMSELLLNEHREESFSNPKVQSIAQARTATVLRILDPVRRVSVIQFLSQSDILAVCVVKSVKGSFDLPLNNENSLASIDLQETNLNGANLSMICLENANLQNTSLKRSNLYETDLSGANLQGAKLTEANLQGARLEGANLQGARLFRANLKKAVLWGANLENANLFEAEVTQEQLNTAKSLKGATMPDGSIHP